MKHRGHFKHQEQAPAAPDYTPSNVVLVQTAPDAARATWGIGTAEPPSWEVQSKHDDLEWGSDINDEIWGGFREYAWGTAGPPGTLWFRIRAVNAESGPISEWVVASCAWA